MKNLVEVGLQGGLALESSVAYLINGRQNAIRVSAEYIFFWQAMFDDTFPDEINILAEQRIFTSSLFQSALHEQPDNLTVGFSKRISDAHGLSAVLSNICKKSG
jgi:hypothetical protein